MSLPLVTLTALFLPAIGLIAIAIMAARRISAISRDSLDSSDWAADLSVERYRPMLRILDPEDIRFLSSQPGVTPNMIDQLRKRRCQVFRGYLQCLERDFRRAAEALMLVMIQSQADRTELLPILIRSRLKFATGLFLVRCRLAMYRWNVEQEPVARLVHLFDGLRLELQTLAAAQTAARA